MAKCKYPSDLRTFFVRKKDGSTVTLSVEAFLARARAEDGESPYTNYGKFSRFKFTHIDGKGTFITASIKPADDVPDMSERTRFANQRIYECEMKNSSTAISESGERLTGAAYTARFTSGRLNGKTPAEVLSEEPEKGKDILNQHYQWLAGNLKKYPRNKLQMDAIVEASNLLSEGRLQKVEGGAAGAVIQILAKEMRPNVHKEPKYGNKYPVSEIGITCHPENNYPYAIEIENYYAPVIKQDDGRLNVRKSEAQDVNAEKFYMSAKDWNSLMQALQTHMRQFEDVIAAQQFKEAHAAEEENKREAKEKSGNGAA